MVRLRGKVYWFSPKKGYGFIRPDKGEPDIFVHSRQLTELGGRLIRGEAVTFSVVDTPKGIAADCVELVDNGE